MEMDMLPIAALILTDDCGDQFLGTDLNERAAMVAHSAGIDHVFFVGRNLPSIGLLARLRAKGVFASGLLEHPKVFSGVPPTEQLVVLPARTVMDTDAFKTILRQSAEDHRKAGLVVNQGPQRKNSIIEVSADGLVTSVMGDGNATSTGVVIVPRHLQSRISTVWSIHDAVHRLAKGGQLRALTAESFYCRPLEVKANVAAAEREYRRHSNPPVWKSVVDWMSSWPGSLTTTSSQSV
jgi:hypothetical protein